MEREYLGDELKRDSVCWLIAGGDFVLGGSDVDLDYLIKVYIIPGISYCCGDPRDRIG